VDVWHAGCGPSGNQTPIGRFDVSDERIDHPLSPALRYALNLVSAFDRSGWVCAPMEPTDGMANAGAAAAGLSPEAARRVYKAMLSCL
jgi:hypothetical protein